MKKFEVHFPDESKMHELNVKFYGPADTPYYGGIWKVNIMLPAEYPFKSPCVGFMNRIFHPNVDEMSGSVCLDVINQTWSPMFDLLNIFESFLPQLLRYPNPADPLNGEAASILLRHPEAFHSRVRDCIRRHASIDFSLDSEDEDEVVEIIKESSLSKVKTDDQDRKCPATSSSNATLKSPVSECTDAETRSPMSMDTSDYGSSPSALPFSLPPPFSAIASSSGFTGSFLNSYPAMKLFNDVVAVRSELVINSLTPPESSSSLPKVSFEELLKDGMDVIDDGASDVSDMSED